jgi:hypothetical protein
MEEKRQPVAFGEVDAGQLQWGFVVAGRGAGVSEALEPIAA